MDPVLAAVASGDLSAYGRWVAGAESRIRLSLRSFASSVDTEVVVQETLLRIWQTAPRLTDHPDGDTLTRVAIRIARNLAIAETRRRRPEPLADLETADEAMDVSGPDPKLRELIGACRERLPKKPRAALDARLSHGVRHDRELADGLRMQLNTFLQNLSRARRLLAECLQRAGVELPGVRP